MKSDSNPRFAPGYEWLFAAVSFSLAVLMGARGAVYVPDAGGYRLLALGRNGSVVRPFAGRILGAAAAGWLGRVTGLGIDRGFYLFGIACLLALLLLMAALLRFWRVRPAVFAAIFLMPFWADLFHDYYLPDLLHAAILAALLLLLLSGRTTLAMLLLFPAYLARESTVLIALCLIWAAWRRLPARAVIAGALATASGILVSGHYSRLGAPGAQGMGEAAYLLGKAGWNFFHNILGLPLWSNALPECKSPIWVAPVPYGYHLGSVRAIGLCPPSAWGPARVLLAWLGVFGIGPAVAMAFQRPLLASAGASGLSLPPRESPGMASNGPQIVYRFSVLYGLAGLLLAPFLGASTDRLVEYGWPFFFVALPAYLASQSAAVEHGIFSRIGRARAGWLLALHLTVCWLAWLAFRNQTTPGYLYAGFSALLLNIVAYGSIRPSQGARIPASSRHQAA